MNHIDYSQYAAWHKCPWFWYERYVNERRPKLPEGQRDDNMAIGSLVHEGLRAFALKRNTEIPQAAIDEFVPTRDALNLAQGLVNEYARRYPNEQWEIENVEEPLVFDIGVTNWLGLAKLDAYFYNPVPCEVESGEEGVKIPLEVGWYGREYKTKAEGIKRAWWIMDWANKMQADFQMLALGAKVHEVPKGILVSVLEKPTQYVPKRKCKGCAETWEFASYVPTSEGLYRCAVCNFAQKLTPLKPETNERRPQFFRALITRTFDRLAESRHAIAKLAESMSIYKNGPSMQHDEWAFEFRAPNKENCVDTIFGPCDYWKNHTYDQPTGSDPTMIHYESKKYMELVQIA